MAQDFGHRATPCFIGVFGKIGLARSFGARRIGAAQHGEGRILKPTQKTSNEIRGWRGFGISMPPRHPLKARQ